MDDRVLIELETDKRIQNIRVNLAREQFISEDDIADLRCAAPGAEYNAADLQISPENMYELTTLCFVHEDGARCRSSRGELGRQRRMAAKKSLFSELRAEEQLLRYRLFAELLRVHAGEGDAERIVRHLARLRRRVEAIGRRLNGA